MMTLRELSEVMWTITHVTITARDADLKFLHEWQFGPGLTESLQMYHKRMAGKLTIVDKKINAHGDANKSGVSEMGWGLKTNAIPKELLDAPVTHLNVTPSYSGETHISIDVEMHPLTVMGLIPKEETT